MFRVVVGLVVVGLMVYSLADLSGSEEEDRGGLPTWLWVLIIVLLPVFGPITWIVTRRARRRGNGGRTARPGRGPRRPSGPVAPDDDPDFLWRLEQEKRRQERRERGDGDGPASPGDGAR